MESTAADEDPTADGQVIRELVRVFTQALRQLGDAGHPNDASVFAAQAWSVVRHTDPVAARRINGMMHYLAGLPGQDGAPYWKAHGPAS